MTNAQRLEIIRRLRLWEDNRPKQIARAFGVSQKCVLSILARDRHRRFAIASHAPNVEKANANPAA
jgi:hypothetical protein